MMRRLSVWQIVALLQLYGQKIDNSTINFEPVIKMTLNELLAAKILVGCIWTALVLVSIHFFYKKNDPFLMHHLLLGKTEDTFVGNKT